MSSANLETTPLDVVIVGGGPIGLELAVACQRVGLSYVVLEAGTVGNTIAWWAPNTRWFSSNERIAVSGVPLTTTDQSKATREQYLDYLRNVVTQFDLNVQTQTAVEEITHASGGLDARKFVVRAKASSGNAQWSCRSAVLAIGGTDHPNRLGIPGETLPHVDGYLRETHRYFRRRVLIVGGRNSAVEAALRLHHVGADVALSYRGSSLPEASIKYWLLPEIKSHLKSGRIKNLLGTVPVEITREKVILESTNADDDQRIEVTADDVLSLIGYWQDKALMQQVGIELLDESRRPRFDEATMETNVPGVYVAGTAVAGTQNSKYKIFLENCHDHVNKIIRHLTGIELPPPGQPYRQQISAQPES